MGRALARHHRNHQNPVQWIVGKVSVVLMVRSGTTSQIRAPRIYPIEGRRPATLCRASSVLG